jgi:hypothetical protein
MSLAAVMPACSTQVAGSPSTVTETYSGPIDVVIALTDSFDVLPNGTCSGRYVFRGVADGAQVETRGEHDFNFVTTKVATRYVVDDYTRRPEDDGKYCVVSFRFVPHPADGDGYQLQFPLPTGGYGFSTPFKPNGLGKVDIAIQSCADNDAPPERRCG